MPTQITWYGHNTWLVETGKHRLLIDPFLDDNPSAPIKAADVDCDFVLVSHGHFDHVADAVSIAMRTGSTVLANFEVGNWLVGQGVAEDKVIGLNPGGGVDQPFGHLKMTIAHHSSSMPDGSYGGVACGLLLTLPEGSDGAHRRVYFACDTALFLDMKLIATHNLSDRLDLAVLPIGDRFTMGPDDAVEATKLINPVRVAPCHYGTWPPIEQDAAAWAAAVRKHTASEPLTPQPGEPFVL
ncbi:metal-dependent hydrolase [Pseudobythopirellula maris]|uniref:UPF0173 metal-dependent hydrolase Mal64_27470 n=1 Tax=Pseudobythopirellula maris TaxID=2527991 RepID=A0A5C5ZIH9_9BACT|nr:metal-dependent hydrolase [Pseudobythopirellula maris]TWT87209.1 metal-dependent hydrolase [Pseudobythopirellula maris]